MTIMERAKLKKEEIFIKIVQKTNERYSKEEELVNLIFVISHLIWDVFLKSWDVYFFRQGFVYTWPTSKTLPAWEARISATDTEKNIRRTDITEDLPCVKCNASVLLLFS